MKKIFFTDLDGTLLTTDKKILPETRETLDKWLAKGNILVLSSGRPLGSIRQVIEDNKLIHDNVYAIAFNGSQIYHTASDKLILTKTLPLESAKQIARIALDFGIYNHSYDATHILAPREDEGLTFYRKTIHLPYKILPDYPEGIIEDPCKILCIDPSAKRGLDELAQLLSEKVANITCVKSSDYLLEVFPSNSGKGQAVIDFAKLMDVSIENTIAAGDECNDLSMLQAAGISIAMKNGRDILKENASYVTEEDNDHNGLVAYLNNLME